MKIDKRQQLITVVTIAIVALWAGDKLVISPMVDLWKARAVRIQKLKDSVAAGKRTLNWERDTLARYQNLLTNALPSEVSAAEAKILAGLDNWKLNSGIVVNSERPQWKKGDKIKGQEDYMTLECRIDASGDIAALTRFLHEIENDPLAVKVEGVDIVSRNPDGRELTLGLSISGLQLAKTTPSKP